MHDHSHVTGDARKRLEAQEAEDGASWQVPPFDTRPACSRCDRRDTHTHANQPNTIMARYRADDPT